MSKINLSNPIVYWSFIILTILLFIIVYQNIKVAEITESNTTTFQKYNFNENEKNLGSYEFPDINVKLESEEKNFFLNIFSSNNNILIFFLLIYSIVLSMLFTFRERSRISKEMLDEKLKIEKERIQSKVSIYENIEEELLKYKNIISPELNVQELDKKINFETNFILFSSRVILEKVLLNICEENSISEETLNNMIFVLYKKRILDPQTNGYAHTIKAFGNRVAHPSRSNPIEFTTKDALLVLSTLVSLLNIFESKKLLEGFQNA